MEIKADALISNMNQARVSFSYNVVDLFRAMRGGCVLGIIARGADACVRSICEQCERITERCWSSYDIFDARRVTPRSPKYHIFQTSL
jgi:hypothetical protein